jgi:hypothetical protein
MTVLIKTWEELSKCKSETYDIKVNLSNCNGWITPKKNTDDSWRGSHYLSTHTFYELTYQYSTKILQQCGFDVQLESWG